MVVAIGGPAGSGKTTLANALSRALVARHLDFDEVSIDVVKAGRERMPSLSEAQVLARLRDERYTALAHATGEALQEGAQVLVVSAPFTSEAVDAQAWSTWVGAVGHEAALTFVWLQLDPGTRRNRMAARGSSRDAELLASGRALAVPPRPVIPALLVDASWPLERQVRTVLHAHL